MYMYMYMYIYIYVHIYIYISIYIYIYVHTDDQRQPTVQQPSAAIRSITRCTSEMGMSMARTAAGS